VRWYVVKSEENEETKRLKKAYGLEKKFRLNAEDEAARSAKRCDHQLLEVQLQLNQHQELAKVAPHDAIV
jgi:hypothetical protein